MAFPTIPGIVLATLLPRKTRHVRDIYEADFRFPIILSPDGVVLDGMHRLCKAFLQGLEEIDAVQLPVMPAYRWRLLPTGEEVAIADKPHGQC